MTVCSEKIISKSDKLLLFSVNLRMSWNVVLQLVIESRVALWMDSKFFIRFRNIDFKWQMLFRKSISFVSMSDKCGIGIAIF